MGTYCNVMGIQFLKDVMIQNHITVYKQILSVKQLKSTNIGGTSGEICGRSAAEVTGERSGVTPRVP